jgi:hypothetical protein
VSRRRERSAKTAGGPGPPTRSRTPYTIRTPQRGGNRHPAWGRSGAATCPQAQSRARPRSFLGKTRPPTAFNTGDVSALCHSRAQGNFCQAALLIACYQGTQCSRWRRPHMSVCYASWTRRLTFAHHDAYAVDPTVYAATYTISTDVSPTGQENPLLSQRVHRAMKRIRGEILNHSSTINAFCAEYYTSALDPPVVVSTPVYASPWAIKGRRPLEKGRGRRSPGRGQYPAWAEDRFIHMQEQYNSQWM